MPDSALTSEFWHTEFLLHVRFTHLSIDSCCYKDFTAAQWQYDAEACREAWALKNVSRWGGVLMGATPNQLRGVSAGECYLKLNFASWKTERCLLLWQCFQVGIVSLSSIGMTFLSMILTSVPSGAVLGKITYLSSSFSRLPKLCPSSGEVSIWIVVSWYNDILGWWLPTWKQYQIVYLFC